MRRLYQSVKLAMFVNQANSPLQPAQSLLILSVTIANCCSRIKMNKESLSARHAQNVQQAKYKALHAPLLLTDNAQTAPQIA